MREGDTLVVWKLDRLVRQIGSAEAHNNLGLALLASGKARESIPEFEVALRLKPALKGTSDNLRRAQAQLK